MDDKLDELIKLQREQNELLRRHLTRIKFSLWALLVMMTGICLVFGLLVFFASSVIGPATPAPTATPSNGTLFLNTQPLPSIQDLKADDSPETKMRTR